MEYANLPITGAYAITPTIFKDNRGQLLRLIDCTDVLQVNESHTYTVGTFRGIHYQPGMRKIVKCLLGRVLDIIVDLRRDSPTYLQNYKTILYDGQQILLYIPPGCGHGVLSLSDHSRLLYFLNTQWNPTLEGGVRWDDPALNLDLPFPPVLLSEKDRSFPDWVP